jgi:hypothetical protein
LVEPDQYYVYNGSGDGGGGKEEIKNVVLYFCCLFRDAIGLYPSPSDVYGTRPTPCFFRGMHCFQFYALLFEGPFFKFFVCLLFLSVSVYHDLYYSIEDVFSKYLSYQAKRSNGFGYVSDGSIVDSYHQ